MGIVQQEDKQEFSLSLIRVLSVISTHLIRPRLPNSSPSPPNISLEFYYNRIFSLPTAISTFLYIFENGLLARKIVSGFHW
jgi:hypothetical protein